MAHSGIADEGARLQIVPNTRKITVPPACKVIGTVGDHNSEQLTFQCPRYIDGHDVKGCAHHYIIYKNAAGGVGRVAVTPELATVARTGADEVIVFTWLISAGVTEAAGTISFAVHFVDTEDDDVTVAYQWSTTACNELQVLPTVTMTGTEDDPDAEPPIVEDLGGSDLPDVTAEDNGAFLRVVDGEWVADQLEDASGVGM